MYSINQRQLLKEYLAKLNDPEYVQNLTKAHVYHDKEIRNKGQGSRGQATRQPLIGSERVTYIQDSNPFFFRQKAGEPASPLPPKPPRLPPQIRPKPQIPQQPYRLEIDICLGVIVGMEDASNQILWGANRCNR